jgi:Cys-rich protein (TIGR01571 family)
VPCCLIVYFKATDSCVMWPEYGSHLDVTTRSGTVALDCLGVCPSLRLSHTCFAFFSIHLQPTGGIQKGQNFHGTIVSQDNVRVGRGDNIPVGAWRDGLCDCCILGPCHPSVCLSVWWFPNIALGQVMTRMGLSWSGDPAGNRPVGLSPFMIMVILTIIFIVVSIDVNAALSSRPTANLGERPPPMPGWVPFLILFRWLVGIGIGLYALDVRIRTRAYIRNKYAIPEMYCTGCDDCCMSFWCSCCTTAQMLRHTADYDANNASCCSETGLWPNRYA